MAFILANQVEAMIEDPDPRVVRSDQELAVSFVVVAETLDAADDAAVHGRDVGVAALDFVDDSVFALVDREDVAHPVVVADDERLAVVQEVDAGRLVGQVDLSHDSVDHDVIDADRGVERGHCELSGGARIERYETDDVTGGNGLEDLVVEFGQKIEDRLVFLVVVLHDPNCDQVFLLNWVGGCH